MYQNYNHFSSSESYLINILDNLGNTESDMKKLILSVSKRLCPFRLAGMADVELSEHHLDELKRMNVYGIVTCTERSQNSELIESCGMEYLFCPIMDFSPPSREKIQDFVRFTEKLNTEGKAVVVHCAAGIGRTGTLLATYMVYQNMGGAVEVIEELRKLRQGSIDTEEQEQIVYRMEDEWGGRSGDDL